MVHKAEAAMSEKKQRSNNQERKGKRNRIQIPGFAVVLVLTLLMPLYLFFLSLYTVVNNFYLQLKETTSTVSMLSDSADELMTRLDDIEQDFSVVALNELKLAAELYERGSLINRPDVFRNIFGEQHGYFIVNPDGAVIAGQSEQEVNTDEIKSGIDFYEKDKEGFTYSLSSAGNLMIHGLSDGNYICRIRTKNEERELNRNLEKLEEALVADSNELNSVVITYGDIVISDSSSVLFTIGDTLSDVIDRRIDVYNENFNASTYTAFIDDRPYFVVELPPNSHGLQVHYIVNMAALLNQSILLVLVTFLIILFALMIIMYFIFQFRKVHSLDDPAAEKELKFKTRILMIAAIGITVVSCYYFKTLLGLKTYVLDDDRELDQIEQLIQNNREASESLKDHIDSVYSRQTEVLANYLSAFPEEQTEERLREISDQFGLQYSILFDRDGNEVISSADYINLKLSKNKEDMSYQFWPLLNGTHVIAAEIGTDDLTGLRHQLVGAEMRSAGNEINGLLMTAYSSEVLDKITDSFTVETLLKTHSSSKQNDYILIDPETKDVLYSPFYMMMGGNAEDLGFDEEKLAEGYSGSLIIDGRKYAITQRTIEDKSLYVVLAFSEVYGNRGIFTALIAISAFVIFLIGAWMMRHVRMKEADETVIRRYQETQDRINGQMLEKNLYAEEKTTRLIGVLIQIFGVILFIVLIFREQLLSQDSIIVYVMEGSMRPGMNVFAVTAVLILVLMTAIGVRLAMFILTRLTKIASPQMETYLRLVRSAVEYLSVLICGYVSMTLLGVKMETLLATSSIMALLVGMGAQDLTEDIIAGLFLMFESEFQVGDVIDIDGRIGRVKEIGLHSTKLIDPDNNVVLLNNSSVRNIINRTKNATVAFSTFVLSSDISIQKLEDIFREELPPLKEKYPQFLKEPYFKGVDSFDGGSMECTVAAEVMETSRTEAERILNSEVQIILLRHEITIG